MPITMAYNGNAKGGENMIDLKTKREEAGLTQLQLAEKVGITLANMSILKTGKAKAIKVSTLIAICDALDCQPGDILEYVDQ